MAALVQNLSKTIIVRGSGRVTFGDVLYGPRGVCGPRTQTDFQLVAIHAGEASIKVGSANYHLAAGWLALMKPGHREVFEFSRTCPTHHTWCAVDPARLARPFRAELAAAPFALPLTMRMQKLFELGLSSPPADTPAAAALIDKLGDALVQEYLAEASSGGKHAPLPDSLRRAKERIDGNPAATLSLAELAKVACCTPNHLTKLFRKHLAISPMRYLWRARVDRGVELLRQTGLSVSEIAYRTGFQTPFHFSRLTRQQHNLSPKELRARAWNTG